jgi:hypothetical protein
VDILGNNNDVADSLLPDVIDHGLGEDQVDEEANEKDVSNTMQEPDNQRDNQQEFDTGNFNTSKRKSITNSIDVEQTKKKRRTVAESSEKDDGTNMLEAEDEDVEDVAPEKTNNAGGPAYSAQNRRVNSALQNLKAKVEEFQIKYGGESDFFLIMRDNMTETNETGRTTRTNRKVIVTGEGSLCEAFKYEGLKFDPKTMQFTKKGKTLEKDFDMLEEWLDKKIEQSSPTVGTPAIVSSPVVTSPHLPPFLQHPLSHVPQMFQNPYPFHPFPYGHLQIPPQQMFPQPVAATPVTLTSCNAEATEPSSLEPESEVGPRPRRLIVSGSESDNASKEYPCIKKKIKSSAEQ